MTNLEKLREEWTSFKFEGFIALDTTNFVSVPESLIAALEKFIEERFGEYGKNNFVK